jgi:hypothetical protein
MADADLTISLINVRIAKGQGDSSTRGVNHLKAAGLHLRDVRAQLTRAQWPIWLRDNIKHPREIVDRCLSLIEKPGEEVYAQYIYQPRPRPPARPLRLMHAPYGEQLRRVITEMHGLGRPTITAVYTDEALYALEGVHRLHACCDTYLQFGATLNCLPLDTVFSYEDRERFFDKQYCTALSGYGDITAAEMVELWGDWPVSLETHRDAIAGPGTYSYVKIFGCQFHPFQLGLPSKTKCPELYRVPASRRIALKDWQLGPDGRYRVKAGPFTATVFPSPRGGWGAWIAHRSKLPRGEFGQQTYPTAQQAMAAVPDAAAWLEQQEQNR